MEYYLGSLIHIRRLYITVIDFHYGHLYIISRNSNYNVEAEALEQMIWHAELNVTATLSSMRRPSSNDLNMLRLVALPLGCMDHSPEKEQGEA